MTVVVAGVAPGVTELLASLLAIGHDAIASHRSAASLWQLRLPTRLCEFTVSDQHNIRTRLGIARYSNCTDVGRSVSGAIPVTSVARTLIDCSAFVGRSTLERAAEDAIVRRLTSFQEIQQTMMAIAARGRRRITIWREILDARAIVATEADSVLALRVAKWIRTAGLPEPVEEFWVTLPGGKRRRCDMAYPDLRIDIECDGRDAHEEVRFDDDRVRDRELELQAGYMVLRFTARSTPHEVVRDVSAALLMRAKSA